jgi:Family of unknown function (DUF6062)
MDQQKPSFPFLDFDDSDVSRNKRSIPWVRLSDALHTSGCPICSVVEASTRKHVNDILYEYVLDVTVRKMIHASFGFCNRHAWLAREAEEALHSDGQHLATLYESLLHAEIRLLSEAAGVQRDSSRKGRKRKQKDPVIEKAMTNLHPTGECLICAGVRRTEEFYASQCTLMRPDDEFRSLFESENVLLCRPHFISVLHEAKEPETIDYFVHQQIGKLEQLYKELKLFIEKHDVRYKNIPWGKEWNSWLQVLEHYSCKKGIDRTSNRE